MFLEFLNEIKCAKRRLVLVKIYRISLAQSFKKVSSLSCFQQQCLVSRHSLPFKFFLKSL